MKSEYFMILLPNDMCCSLQSFNLQPIALKTKKLRRKVSQIKAQCSSINDGASLITRNCTINNVENGTRFSYDTRGQDPEKIPYFCPGIHSYFYKDCGCTISTCLLSLLNQSAEKLFYYAVGKPN